jgi:hypothetical protein
LTQLLYSMSPSQGYQSMFQLASLFQNARYAK